MKYAFVFLIQNGDTRKTFTDDISAIQAGLVGVNPIVDRDPSGKQFEYYAINAPGFDPATNTDRVSMYLVMDNSLSPSFKQPIQVATSQYDANTLTFSTHYARAEMVRRAKVWVGEIGPDMVCFVDNATVIPADLKSGFKPLLTWYNSPVAETIGT